MTPEQIEKKIKYYQRRRKKLRREWEERKNIREYLELDRDPEWMLKKADR